MGGYGRVRLCCTPLSHCLGLGLGLGLGRLPWWIPSPPPSFAVSLWWRVTVAPSLSASPFLFICFFFASLVLPLVYIIARAHSLLSFSTRAYCRTTHIVNSKIVHTHIHTYTFYSSFSFPDDIYFPLNSLVPLSLPDLLLVPSDFAFFIFFFLHLGLCRVFFLFFFLPRLVLPPYLIASARRFTIFVFVVTSPVVLHSTRSFPLPSSSSGQAKNEKGKSLSVFTANLAYIHRSPNSNCKDATRRLCSTCNWLGIYIQFFWTNWIRSFI